MAKNFKNFRSGFRINPISDASTDVIDPQIGDITFEEEKGLRLYVNFGEGAGWHDIQVAQGSLDSGKAITKFIDVDNSASYQNPGESNDKERYIFYATPNIEDSRLTAIPTYAASTITENNIVIDMVNGRTGDDIIDDVSVFLPECTSSNKGQTYTVYRKDSHKQAYTLGNIEKGETDSVIKIHAHHDATIGQQKINITGFNYVDNPSTYLEDPGESDNGVTGTADVDYVQMEYNQKKITLMSNGTKWIILSDVSEVKSLVPIGTVLMSVLNATEFNKETAGNWKICDGGAVLEGTRLQAITGWTRVPDLCGTDSTTPVPSQATYPNNRVGEPSVGTADVATGVQLTATDNIVGSRIADAVYTGHLGLTLGIAAQTFTTITGVDAQGVAFGGNHIHTMDEHTHSIPGTWVKKVGGNPEIPNSGGSTQVNYNGITVNGTTSTMQDGGTHDHTISIGFADAKFTTKTITNSTTLDTGESLSSVTRPYTVLFNFFIRID